MQWSTYYSGTDYEESRGVCVDGLGFAYIVGSTYSPDFPITVGCYQPIIEGSADAFLVKFNSSGVRQFATYFGGTTFDIAHKVDKDNSNNIWITGGTTNNTFPTTAGAYDVSYNGGGNDVFLTKFTSSGSLLYSTFIGGSSQEYGSDVDFTTGLKITLTGIISDSLNEEAISCECLATCFNVSSPYKCWLPVTNQTSNVFKLIMYFFLLLF